MELLQQLKSPKIDGMELVTEGDYRKFVSEASNVSIENVKVEIGKILAD